MKKELLFLAFIFFTICLHANENVVVDSLYKQLINAEDSIKAEILNELSWELRNSEPEKSIEYGIEAIKFAEQFNDYENLVQAHGFIGVAYRIIGNYSESMDYYFKGLELAKKYNQKEQEGYAYINIGNLHIYQGYYYNAIENLNKAQDIAEELGHKRMLGYVHLNIGRAQMLRNENLEALKNFNKALQIRIEIDQVSGQAVCYKYIGDIYLELGDERKALTNYQQSLKVVDKEMDKDLYANIHTMIAKTYFTAGNYELAQRNANKSMKIASEIGAKLIIRDNFKVLADIDLKTNQYKSAAEHLTSIINYNDTLFNQQLSEKMFNLEYRFEKERKQAEIDILNKDKQIRELELRRARTFNIALVVILLLLAVMFIYVLMSLRERRKQNLLLEKQKEELDNINKTKDKMFLIIGHDLRGPIGNLKSLIEMLLEDEEITRDKSLMETFNIFMKSVQSVSDLLENLLLWAKSQRNDISFSPENISINTVINRNLQLFKTVADHKGVQLTFDIKENYDVFADKNMLMTVVRNLISNAIKYTPKNGNVNVTVGLESNYTKIAIADSGVGFDQETANKILDPQNFYTTSGTNNEAGSGLGLLLSKEFVEINGGKIWAESIPGKGATFYFTIPVSDMS
ncbi:MAG: tetratricopeptide repeat protein [Bacteroidetes bacterium]|nr:tetratricopeptide repeat protein [Bacteroidota bacterium]